MEIFKILLRKPYHLICWDIINNLQWFITNLSKRKNNNEIKGLTLGMVTYVARFDIFKKVITRLQYNFPKNEIIIIANGYYDESKQKKYLIEIEKYLIKFSKIKLIKFEKPQSLSKLWNQIILCSKTEKILIFNDDLDFARNFYKYILKSSILQEKLAIINGIWSHFLISKDIIKKVGWFDERLYGVGGEDWDYEARLAFSNIILPSFSLKGIRNIRIITKDFSYGEKIQTVAIKYTKSSSDFLFKKWEIVNEKDNKAKFVRIWGNYIKPVKGMETPKFYEVPD